MIKNEEKNTKLKNIYYNKKIFIYPLFSFLFPSLTKKEKMSDNVPVKTQMLRELEKGSLKLVIGKCLDFHSPVAGILLAECLFGRLAPQNAHIQKVISIVTPLGVVIGRIVGKWKDTLLEKLKRGVS